MDALTVPGKPYYLLDFEDPETVPSCKTFSDKSVGGFSDVKLDHVQGQPESNDPTHARFHGTISTRLPSNWRVQRTGYAAFRNHDRGLWLFGRLHWDVDAYKYLAVRVKSDGRRYKVNVQTDSIVDTDIHQHRLFTHHHRMPVDAENPPLPDGVPPALADIATTPASDPAAAPAQSAAEPDFNGWETVMIKWSDFVRTSNGLVIEPQTDISTQRIRSVGIGLTDRIEGPFDLRIHRIWATNGLTEEEMDEERRLCGPLALRPSAVDDEVHGAGKEGTSVVDNEEKELHRFKGLGKGKKN